MSKSLILLLAIVSLVASVPMIRKNLNFNEEKLTKCLKEKGVEYDEKVEELRKYHDTLRKFLFSKKFEEYKFNEDKRDEMIQCFDKYGIAARMVSPGANCMDVCHYTRPGEICNCPKY